jgi:hypothetical protein
LADDIWTSEQYKILPGAEQTLTRLSAAGVILVLVSGAMEGAARTKLMPADLNGFFLFGAYGSDSPDRGDSRVWPSPRPAVCTTTSRQTRSSSLATHPARSMPRNTLALSRSESPRATTRPTDYVRAGAALVLASLKQAFPGL